MSRVGAPVFAAGSLSWAAAQWLLVWMFARFAGGPDAVGGYALVLSIATPIFTLAQFGLRTVYLSLRVRFPWRTYVTLRLGGILVAVTLLGIYFGVGGSANIGIWVSMLFVKSADVYFDLLQARIQRSDQLLGLGILNLLNSGGTIVLSAVSLWIFGSVASALVASGIVSTLISGIAQVLVSRDGAVEPTGPRGYPEILRAGFPTMLAELLASVSSYLPLFVLSRLADEARVGIFAAASYLLTFANLSGAIVKNILITRFRRTFEAHGARSLMSSSHRYAWALAIAGVGISPIVVVFGTPLMRFVYGTDFEMSYAALAILALAVIPIAPAYVYSTTLNVMHRFTSQAWIWVSSIVAGVSVGAICALVGIAPTLIALAIAAAAGWSRFAGTLWSAMRAMNQNA